MQKLLISAVVLAGVSLVAAASYWAGKSATNSAGPGPAAAQKPTPGVIVEASRVSLVKLPQALSAVGSLRSDETVVVRPEVAGRIVNFAFREGEPIASGQVLVKLDDSVQKA